MKNTFLIFCLLFYTAQAQGKFEIKANVLPFLLSSQAELSAEYLLRERLGIEAGVGYYWSESKSGYRDTISTTGGIIWDRITKSRKVNFYVSGKYYFKPKYGGDRFFTGVLLHHVYYSTYTVNGQDVEKFKRSTAV